MKRDDVLDFFTQLDRLPKGDRTALKREAGTMLHEADGRAIQAFYKCMLPTIPERYDDRFLLWLVCIVCGAKIPKIACRWSKFSISWGRIRKFLPAQSIGWWEFWT